MPAVPVEPLLLSVSQALRWDNNVFRVPGDQGPESELISITQAGLLLDRALGRQRLTGDFKLGWAHYRDHDDLSGAVYDLAARLDWSTVGRLAGEVGMRAVRDQYLNRDSTTVYEGDNALTTTSVYLNARKGNVTRWTVEAGLAASDSRFSASAFRNRDVQQWTGIAGLRYQATPGASVRLGLRRSEGRYPNFADGVSDAFRRNAVELAGGWAPGGASAVDLRLSYGRTSHTEIAQREGEDWSGGLRWRWRPTDKLLLTTRLSRDSSTGVSGFDDTLLSASDAAARQTDAVNWAVRWSATAKITADLALGLQRRTLDRAFDGAAASPALTDADRTTSMVLTLGYKPTLLSDVSCSVGREHRRTDGAATGLTYGYRARSVRCAASLGFR